MAHTALFDTWPLAHIAVLSVLIASVAEFALIGLAAFLRFNTSSLDGSKPDRGTRLDIVLRALSNTTEQLILFAAASAGLAAFAPGTAKSLLPVAAIWFLVARLAFLVGYMGSPPTRAFGFAATFHPIVAIAGLAIWAAFAYR